MSRRNISPATSALKSPVSRLRRVQPIPIVILALLILAMVGTVAVKVEAHNNTTITTTPRRPPQGETPTGIISAPLQDAAIPPSAGQAKLAEPDAAEPLETLEEHRAKRREVGSRSVESQLDADFPTLTPLDAHVVVTFETPMPWDFYQRNRGGDGPYILPMTVDTVSLYAEMEDGYPYSTVASPDEAWVSTLNTFLSAPEVRMKMGVPDTAPPVDMTGRTVLLGFTMDYLDFVGQEEFLRKQFGVKAAEVTSSSAASAMGADFPLIPATMEKLDASYTNGEVGNA